MVPIHTFLILLGTLILFSTGCSQRLPPHTDSNAYSESTRNKVKRDELTQAESKPSPTATPKTDLIGADSTKEVTIDLKLKTEMLLEQKSEMKIRLRGVDAGYLFNLMSIATEKKIDDSKNKKEIKMGHQFYCERDADEISECVLVLNMETGSVKPLVELDAVKPGKPSTTFAALKSLPLDGFIKLFTPEKSEKPEEDSRFDWVIKIKAQELFLALPSAREVELKPVGVFGKGLRRQGESLDCYQQSYVSDQSDAKAGVPFYTCYLYLNPLNGSIDKFIKTK